MEQKQKEMFEEELRGIVFEVMPSRGRLEPKCRMNVQVKFMPKEQVSFLFEHFISEIFL